jgi:predicted small metal-binding protein
MLQLSCNDIGVLGCDFVAQGKRTRTVASRMLDHVRDAHPQLAAGLSFEQHKQLEARIADAMRAQVKADHRPERAPRSTLRAAVRRRSEILRLPQRSRGTR